jgi:hypothetical protein
MESDTGYSAIIAALVMLTVGGFFGALWFFMRRAKSDPTMPQPYPFDDPNFIHVGLTPRQLAALSPIGMELRFMQWIPHHENQAVDATYYAMSREEFITFYGVVMKHTRNLMAKAAREAMINKAVILEGDAYTLSELLIGLTQIRQRIAPVPLPQELHIPIDSAHA